MRGVISQVAHISYTNIGRDLCYEFWSDFPMPVGLASRKFSFEGGGDDCFFWKTGQLRY
jgi:hypothetical protein